MFHVGLFELILPPATRLSNTLNVECAAKTVLERCDHPLDLDDCKLNRCPSKTSVGGRENLARCCCAS